jgi:hypothetical protein
MIRTLFSRLARLSLGNWNDDVARPLILEPGLFTMRGRRHGESLFHWGVAQTLWFQQVTHDVKLVNLQKPVATSAESSQAPNQTPVVVNNSG